MIQKKMVPAVSKKDHIIGKFDAPIALVEYADFECSDSLAVYPIIKKLVQEFGSNLLFVFRHFPLTDVKYIHPHANQAHVASEIAAENGKFWEMHDKLFENQTKLERTDFAGYLSSIGVKIPFEQFEDQMKNVKYWKVVAKSVKNGIKSGVTGTPRFFINGVLYQEKETYIDLKKALEAGKRKK